MKRYKVIKDGVETNAWLETFAGADYYEPCFGAPGTYEIVEEDVAEPVVQKSWNEMSFLERLKSGLIG
jgi:hypothetical protein